MYYTIMLCFIFNFNLIQFDGLTSFDFRHLYTYFIRSRRFFFSWKCIVLFDFYCVIETVKDYVSYRLLNMFKQLFGLDYKFNANLRERINRLWCKKQIQSVLNSNFQSKTDVYNFNNSKNMYFLDNLSDF